MKYKNQVIGAGTVLYVMQGWGWVPWTVSDFSPATGDIYGRTAGGPYEELRKRHNSALLRGDDGKPVFPKHRGAPPRVAMPPKMADLCRQGRAPN